MKIEAKNKSEYFQKVGEREPDLRQLDELIRTYAPDLPEAIAGGMYGNMLAYGMMRYTPKSAKEETQWPLLMLGAQKNHISLYACAVVDGQYVAEKYASKLGKVSCGKSCIRFKKFEDLDRQGTIEMLKDLNARYKNGEKLYGV